MAPPLTFSFSCGSRRTPSVVGWASPIEPVAEQRGEQVGPLVHHRVAGVLDDSEGGMRIALEQFGRVGVPDDRIPSSGHDQGRRRDALDPTSTVHPAKMRCSAASSTSVVPGTTWSR